MLSFKLQIRMIYVLVPFVVCGAEQQLYYLVDRKVILKSNSIHEIKNIFVSTDLSVLKDIFPFYLRLFITFAE